MRCKRIVAVAVGLLAVELYSFVTVACQDETSCPELLRGRDGRDGLPGVPGTPGAPGRDGQDGKNGNQGPQGIQGVQGPPGLPAKESTNSGIVYTRWGSSSCPSISGTELIYSGRVGGSHHDMQGGAANYLCLPEDPEYTLPSRSGHQGYATIHETEYEGPLSPGTHNHNVPCAVCHVTNRSSLVMIPAKTSCPTSWTREYYGYVMGAEGELWGSRHRKMFECFDKGLESVPGGNADTNPSVVYHVEVECSIGLPCPPYQSDAELNCVVCTK